MNQDEGIMARFEQEAHSFVIRVWQENQGDLAAPVIWRGWIEHVQTNHRYYFTDAEKLQTILFNYLENLPDMEQLLFHARKQNVED